MTKQRQISIGSDYLVDSNGSLLPATILEQRHSKDSVEFYVHYHGQDRRLDEWIGLERISKQIVSEPVVESTASEPKDDRKLTRNMKRKLQEQSGTGVIDYVIEMAEDPQVVAWEKEREEITKLKNIEAVYVGDYKIGTWYYSPYPEEYRNVKELYICQFCLKYMQYPQTLVKHQRECPTHPPGKLVYSKGKNKIFEIDAANEKLYCQNLCLLSKLFLDHKTVYYDIDPFLFYVLTETGPDVKGNEVDHFVGYFSKEKGSLENHNLACITTLPPFQKKGYGRLLIEFSYVLSKIEGKIGGPERPLSDLGLVSYRSYWTSALLLILRDSPHPTSLTLKDLATLTSIKQEDILSTLTHMNMIRFWRGENIVCVTKEAIDEYIDSHGVKLYRMIDLECVDWEKPVFVRQSERSRSVQH